MTGNGYNSESITLAKGNAEYLEKRFCFCAWKSVSTTAIVCGYVSLKINLLTLLFWKFFVLYLWEGKIMVLRFLSNMEISYL